MPPRSETGVEVALLDPLVQGPSIPIAYRDSGISQKERRKPAVLLLHGSPGSSRDFLTLGPALIGRFRILAPDLPGFGYSGRRVPDYSIRTHALYTVALLDHLGIERVHAVGFSMGGGVALELAQLAPERLRSLTLLSSIGVQELELLGSYSLNHAIHGLQLALLWILHETIPHFGLFDAFPLDVAYARNFYDTDQRPLRGILQSLQMPVLILHGRDDFLVPVAAAREHQRLVPQSELVLFESNHFLVFRGGDRLAVPITDFIDRVERGVARTRFDASEERKAAAAGAFDPTRMPQAHGLNLLVLMLLLALATLASEDLASIGTGLLVAQGRLGFFAGSIACGIGILLGDVAIYWAGRLLGRPWLRRIPLRWIVRPEAVERGTAWFEKRGPRVVIASRFLPGTRVGTYFAAGVLATRFWRFFFFLCAAVVVWVPALVGLAAVFGTRIYEYFELLRRRALPSVALLAVVGWLLFRLLRALGSRRGRRLLVGWWLRWTRWEFWPPWLFYPPILAWIARLAVRHRSLTVFTAANPAIPGGGFVGESKAAILDGIDPKWPARYSFLPAGDSAAERLGAVRSFLDENDLGLPVVLKPDIGERGRKVTIVRTQEELESRLDEIHESLLIQQYLPGPELGIFYYRFPNEERGTIFSVTEKRLPVVQGDGTSTVEDLILGNPRAVALAPRLLDRFAADLERVPTAGESLALVELGTHCMGAVFVDGSRWKTPKLEEAVEQISQSFEGFFFGRYDLKAPTYEDFRRGEDIKVLELNGVTSEATHIYDSTYSLSSAYRTLFRQWELAFEIGRQNRQRGFEPAQLRELVARLWQHLREK
jgi:pimeloyl-ACP methyl ester carboxylesterase/membrane protein DedA with SNARE-associated domain